MALTDRALTAGQIWKIAELLEGSVLSRFQTQTFSLSASGWADKKQALSSDFFQAGDAYHYLIGSDTDCQTVYSSAGVTADNITTSGQIVFQCTSVPETDLTVNIIRLEVEA